MSSTLKPLTDSQAKPDQGESRPSLTCTEPINQIGIQTSSPLAFSSNGETMAYSDGTHGISIFSVDASGSLSQIAYLIGHSKTVNCILFHPTLPVLVSCGIEGIIVWDETKLAIKHQIFIDSKDAHSSDVMNMCWLYGGTVLASCSHDSTIRFWNVNKDFSLIEVLSAHKSSVLTMTFNLEREYLVSAGRDSSINVWRTSSLSPDNLQKRYEDKGIVCTLECAMDGHMGDVSVLGCTSDGLSLFSGARDNTIRAWDMRSFKCVREISDPDSTLGKHKADIIGLFCLNANSILLSASFDGTIKIFQLGSLTYDPLADGGDISNISMDDLLKGITVVQEVKVVQDKLLASIPVYPNSGIFRLVLNPTMPLLAVSSKDNSLRVYNIAHDICSPQLLREFASHNSVVNQIAQLRNGNMVSVSDDYRVNVFDATSNMRLATFNAGTAIATVAACDDMIFVGGRDYCVHTFSVNRDKYYSAMELNFTAHNSVPDDSMYDLHEFKDMHGKVRSIAYSEDYHLLCAVCDDGSLSVFGMPEFSPADPNHPTPAKSAPRSRVFNHTGLLQRVAVSRLTNDNVYVATGGNDYKINVYLLLKNGKLRHLWDDTLEHRSVITSLLFGVGPNSTCLYSGGWDCDILVWDVATGDVKKRLKGHRARICDLSCSPDGKYLISASADKEILLWENYNVIASYVAKDIVQTVLGLRDCIAAGYHSGVIRMWPYLSDQTKTSFKHSSV